MARFSPRRIHFGEPPVDADDEDDGRDLPRPKLLKLRARRAAGIKEAADLLAVLPGPNESLHAVVTARVDLCDMLGCLLVRAGPCDRMLIATLGYGPRNLKSMLRWLDDGRVDSLTLCASIFFRSHNGALWEQTLAEFRRRGQRAACCHSHAKVASMTFASGEAFAVEGSANLRASGSAREQFCLVNSPELVAWHEGWISDLVTRHEGEPARP
jgi:hypothetical protein